jgi:hypothetical protein
MKELWFIRLKAETHTMDGKRRRINRSVPVGNHLQTTLDTVNKVKNPWEFYGVTLHVFTPLHHTEYVIDPDTREISCIS